MLVHCSTLKIVIEFAPLRTFQNWSSYGVDFATKKHVAFQFSAPLSPADGSTNDVRNTSKLRIKSLVYYRFDYRLSPRTSTEIMWRRRFEVSKVDTADVDNLVSSRRESVHLGEEASLKKRHTLQ